MLGNFFKKKAVQKVDVSPSAIVYLGDISGNGVDYARYELTLRASKFPMISNAWLAKVKYDSEGITRIMFVVDSTEESSTCRRAIAEACSDVMPMDIMFADMLPAEIITKIKCDSSPLYLANAKLFHCPIVAKPIDNDSVPKEWLGAIVNMYVADADHESALRRAAMAIVNDGYGFVGVHENRVSQLSPEAWWDGHVLAMWPEHSSHFPTQDEIFSFVRCGGILKGPVLGWETESV